MPTSVLLRLDEASVGEPGWRPADPTSPLLPAAELAAGSDGVFETVAVVDGLPRDLATHLRRLQASAARCGIAAPPAALWAEGVARAVAALPPRPALSITAVLYGGDPASPPTGWITGRVPPDFVAVRSDGVRVAVLERGVLHDAAAPWLRLDAKTLSYAVARAALRESLRRGADEVVFRSTDGYLLEGATASVLLRTGDALQTPGHGTGVLAGTTVARLLRFGRERGLHAEAVPLPADALARADAAWLVSSVRRAVPIVAVDGLPLARDHALTNAFDDAIAAPPVR